jgi:two-component system, cell cycle sensor histidine kinase and response regulator CckA
MSAPALYLLADAEGPPLSSGEDEASRPPLKPRTSGPILVVDDEDWSRQITARMLRESGYTVLEASSGKQALEILRAGHVSLVLTDLAMPEMDGMHLAQTIRQEKPRQRIAFISAYAGLIARLGKEGAPLPMLEKPVSADELTRQVREILKNR